jgi:hypothetical protein
MVKIIRQRNNRKYGTMKLTGKMTVQLSQDTAAYIKEQAKLLRLSYGAAIDLLVRKFAGE